MQANKRWITQLEMYRDKHYGAENSRYAWKVKINNSRKYAPQ